MGRGAVRWIAIALIGALVATVAVALAGGGSSGDGSGQGSGDADRDASAVGAGDLEDGPHVVLELCAGTTCPSLDEDGQQAVLAEVEADPRVASSLLVSSEQAYQLFMDRYGDDRELVESISPEDVPARIELDVYEADAVAEVMASYKELDGVATAYDARRPAP